MTVSSEVNRWEYLGDGATTTFAYTNKIFADTDLEVWLDGSLQTLTTHYTVTGAGNPTGGNVVFVTAPASGAEVVILRKVANTQTTNYVENDPFPAESHEDALDRRTIVAQQQQEAIDRSLKFRETEQNLPTARLPSVETLKGKFLGFDATTGVPVAFAILDGSEVVVSLFMEPILSRPTASEVRDDLGVAIGTDVQGFDQRILNTAHLFNAEHFV